MWSTFKVEPLGDKEYEVVQTDNPEWRDPEWTGENKPIEHRPFKGTIVECDAFISLRQKGCI